MRKVLGGIGILFLLISGCSSSNLLPHQPIEKVVVKKPDDQRTYTTTDEEEIQMLKQAFQGAQKLNGVMDIRTHDYEVTFYFDDEESKTLWMWLTKKSGMAMDPSNTHIGYDLKSSHVKDLHSIHYFKNS
ncbi:hypothetical protein GWK91_15855 [Virgibacillus sp. MSP4-1]|uniref:hypothetical protein n=1 Tax=Virgibacillus sp. MSP4-1 TaxID=2700081 RepID=UPI0003A7F15C|nr:hypothetical protein [Virgibacillus sp. MSP4-1]QHS24277.1 hypothetical protein GWK91_15855 [Virgibacillus sp. MSP4-1]